MSALTLAVFAPDGVTLLGLVEATQAGESARILLPNLRLGSYLLRVGSVTASDEPQAYLIKLSGAASGGAISFVPSAPAFIAAGLEAAVTVELGAGTEIPVPSTVTLNFRRDGEVSYHTLTMASIGADRYRAALPALSCGESLEYFASVRLRNGELVTSICSAPAAGHRLSAGYSEVVFADSFDVDRGWSIENDNIFDGSWERGIPAGDGFRGDPLSDADGNGWCMLTGNRAGNSDLDGGPTKLISPPLDLSQFSRATLSYSRWFSQNTADGDIMASEVSDDDGVTWVRIESTGDAARWTRVSVELNNFVTLSDRVRVRFLASDSPNNSVVEAGLDAVLIQGFSCVAPCPADFNRDGGVDGSDVEAFFRTWESGVASADVNEDGGVDNGDVERFLFTWERGGC
jgi:hypothetical protein